MTVYGRNADGWRMSWWRIGKGRWQFVVWPHEKTKDGRFTRDHPLFRPPSERPEAHHKAEYTSKDECQREAFAWTAAHAGRPNG